MVFAKYKSISLNKGYVKKVIMTFIMVHFFKAHYIVLKNYILRIMGANICKRCGSVIYHLVDFGTNKDGTINSEFCNNCYVAGEIVDHGISLEKKVEKNVTAKRRNRLKKQTQKHI